MEIESGWANSKINAYQKDWIDIVHKTQYSVNINREFWVKTWTCINNNNQVSYHTMFINLLKTISIQLCFTARFFYWSGNNYCEILLFHTSFLCVGSKNLSNSTFDENNICWDSVYSIMMDRQFDFYIGVIIIPPECYYCWWWWEYSSRIASLGQALLGKGRALSPPRRTCPWLENGHILQWLQWQWYGVNEAFSWYHGVQDCP